MPAGDYRVVPYSSEHTGQVLQLQKHLWGPDEDMNAAYLDWKHLRNPYLSEPLIYLAVHGERVVGMRSFVGAEWEFGSPRQTLVLPLASDLVVAPDHRSRGLPALIMKTALSDLARKGYSYVLSMAAIQVTVVNQMKTGWRGVGSLRPMDCSVVYEKPLPMKNRFLRLRAFLGKSSLAASAVRRLHGISRKMFLAARPGSVDWFHEPRSHNIGGHISVGKTPRVPEMVRLKRRLTNDSRIRHVYDEVYHGWRFQNPRNRYRFLFLDKSELEGYLILQAGILPTSEPVGILDWEASSDQVRTELLQAALQLVHDRAVSLWSATLPGNELRSLEAAGFRPRESTPSHPHAAAVRHVDDDMLNQEWRLGNQRLLDMNNWDFRMIHSRAY